jgi:hypothetical protein
LVGFGNPQAITTEEHFSFTVPGNAIAGITVEEAFALGVRDLAKRLEVPIMQYFQTRGPVDSAIAGIFLKRWGAWAPDANEDHILDDDGTPAGGGWLDPNLLSAILELDITVTLNNAASVSRALASARMPQALQSFCCDSSFCPANTTPNVETVSIDEVVNGRIRTRNVSTVVCKADRNIQILREGCIMEGTEVTLADGTTKKIEDIALGDEIKSENGGSTKVSAINSFTQATDELYSINAGRPLMTLEHPVLTTEGWKAVNPSVTTVKSDMGTVGKLEVGDMLVTPNGPVKIQSLVKHTIGSGVTAYNLATEDQKGFVAGGVIVKGFNKVQVQY